MGRLDGKVAVILGASDARSMGAATALRFAAEGEGECDRARLHAQRDDGGLFCGAGRSEGVSARDAVGTRPVTVEDIANAALWLASDEAFITGQVIDITAGQSLRRIPTAEEMAG